MLSLLSPLSLAFMLPASGNLSVHLPVQSGVVAGFALQSAASGAAVTVRNADQLRTALASPAAGATIMLAPGNYGDLSLRNRIFENGLTLVSLDPSRPARFDTVRTTNVSNLRLQGLTIGRALRSGETSAVTLITVQDSRSIALDGLTVASSADGNFTNDAKGVLVNTSSDVRITGSRFSDLRLGINALSSSNLQIAGNDIRRVSMDGIQIGNANNVVVADNFITDIHWLEPDHPDGIQFWAKEMTSTNIVVRGNIVLQGRGRGAQGVFMRATTGSFRGVRIENNLVYGADQFNGIMVEGGSDVLIAGNNALSPSTDRKTFWVRVENVAGATVRNNLTDQVVIDSSGKKSTGLRIENNLSLKEKPSYVARIADLNKLAAAQPGGLTLPNVGYLSAGGAASLPAPLEQTTLTGNQIAGAASVGSDAPTSAPVRTSAKTTPAPAPAKPTRQQQLQTLLKARSQTR